MKTNILFAICLISAAFLGPARALAQVEVIIEKEVNTDTSKNRSPAGDDFSRAVSEYTQEIQKLALEMQKLQMELSKKRAADKNDSQIEEIEEELEDLNDRMEEQGELLEAAIEDMQEGLMKNFGDLPGYRYTYEYTSKNGDTTIVRTGDTTVDEDIVIRIGDNGICWKKGDEEEFVMNNKNKPSTKVLPKYKTQMFGLDLGVNAFAQELNGTGNTTERDPMALDVAKSVNVTLHLFRQGISLYRNHLYMTMGLALDFHNYRLDENIALTPETDSFAYAVLPENLKRNKLAANYITIPVMLHLESNPRNPNRSFKLGFGGYGGVRYSAFTKQVDTKGKKEKYRDDFNLNTLNYGLRGQVGYGPFSLYGHYALSPLFAEGHSAPELNPVTVGIVLNGFKWR